MGELSEPHDFPAVRPDGGVSENYLVSVPVRHRSTRWATYSRAPILFAGNWMLSEMGAIVEASRIARDSENNGS